jgi:hypothetical protein
MKAWGLLANNSEMNLDLAQDWKIIFKQQITYYDGIGERIMISFDHNTTDTNWEPGGLGGQFSTNNIDLIQTGASANIISNNLTLSNTNAIDPLYYNTNNPTYFELIKHSSTGYTNINIYDHTYNIIYSNEITNINYNTNLIIVLYYNRIIANISGILYAQNHTISPNDLEKY